jgi:hypothetical protein
MGGNIYYVIKLRFLSGSAEAHGPRTKITDPYPTKAFDYVAT